VLVDMTPQARLDELFRPHEEPVTVLSS
jgi:hypothetical protein